VEVSLVWESLGFVEMILNLLEESFNLHGFREELEQSFHQISEEFEAYTL
jgi:hypothetical protein